jgi:hypothetical protein
MEIKKNNKFIIRLIMIEKEVGKKLKIIKKIIKMIIIPNLNTLIEVIIPIINQIKNIDIIIVLLLYYCIIIVLLLILVTV